MITNHVEWCIGIMQEKENMDSIEVDIVVDVVGWGSCNIVILSRSSSGFNEKWTSVLGFLLSFEFRWCLCNNGCPRVNVQFVLFICCTTLTSSAFSASSDVLFADISNIE